MAKTFSTRRKLFYSVIILVASVLLLEFMASLYLQMSRGYDGEHLQWHSYDPYKNIIPTPGYVDTRGVSHNSVGFRGSVEYTITKPDNTFRLVLMGGSTAYGLGSMWPWIEHDFPVLRDADTLGVLLEEALKKVAPPGIRIEVINAGIASHWTHHHIIHLNQKIFDYQPDLVVFLDGFNDYFFFDEAHNQFASYPHTNHANEIMGDPTLRSLVYANGWWLFRKSALTHLVGRTAEQVGYLLEGSHERKPLDLSVIQPGQKKVFERNALKMNQRIAAMLKAEGVRGLFVLQPMLILERDRQGSTSHEQELFDFAVSSYLPNYEQFMLNAVPFVSERMQQTVMPWGAGYLDATSVFEGVTGQVYTDYCHLTPLGNRVLADFIATSIGAQVNLGGGPEPSDNEAGAAPLLRSPSGMRGR